MLSKIFTWWNGATIGTLFTVGKRGQLVGTDEFGNRYYQSRDNVSYDGRKRRWVIYDGYAEATKVPPEWQELLALEPAPRTFELLQRNVEAEGLGCRVATRPREPK